MNKNAHRAEQYAADVRSGKILTCELVQLAVERYYDDIANALDNGWHFDTKAALRAISFIENLVHTKGPLAGKPLILEPWQCFIVWNIFGWMRADGSRRFRYAYIEVSRKNGKTTFASAISLYMLIADSEDRAECYSVATTREQAAISFQDAKAVVQKTGLKQYLKVMRNSIVDEQRGGMFKALSSDADKQDGFNPNFCIIDEYHAHKNSDMFDVMKSGIGSRTQPIMFTITTAGFNKSGPCFAYRDNAIKVLHGTNLDPSLFCIIYTLDDPEEWDNPQMWIKANPNMGVSCRVDYMDEQIKDAKNRPEAVRNVKTKNLNLWVDAATTWIKDDDWMACVGDTNIEDLEGCDCWGGMDLSSVNDVTAVVFVFNQNGKFQLLPIFWIPHDKLIEKVKNENINYDYWRDAGYVRMTPGNVIDYNYIKADILEFGQKYNIKSIAYDPWNSSQIVIDLQDEGVKLTPLRQGFGSMAAPTKQFQIYVLSRLIEHFGNPTLRWMISSTSVATDPAGNIKPDKKIATQKIDGAVASIMAIAEYMTAAAKEPENPYATRGLLGS